MTAPAYERFGVTVYAGDCLDVLAELPDSSVHAVCTDPPYGLEFMGKDWDSFRPAAARLRTRSDARTNPAEGKSVVTTPEAYVAGPPFQEWCTAWAAECLRVLKPGGHLVAFGGSRTWHRLTAAVEDAGFEIRDSIAWLYASGFPKSLDVSKAIDRAAGVERVVTGAGRWAGRESAGDLGVMNDDAWQGGAARVETAPATDAARQWVGWGTALKPGFEPIVVARKPLAGTVAGNVQEHGVGALNIDACRVEWATSTECAEVNARAGPNSRWWDTVETSVALGDKRPNAVDDKTHAAGRWPSNVVFTHAATPDGVDLCGDGCVPGCPVRELDEQGGVRTSGAWNGRRNGTKTTDTFGAFEGGVEAPRSADTGSASRFFPVFRFEAKAPAVERPRVDGVAHPTVKPLALMRWLIRLVTPPKGRVLDLFAGSGTTGQACRAEGFECVLIEREESYLPLIRGRLDGDQDDLFGGVA